MHLPRLAAAVAVAALVVAPAARADDPPLIALGAGAMDFDHSLPAAEFRGEYRFAQGIWVIKPMIGAFGTTRGSVYAYGGLRADFILFDHYVIMPNAAVGYYARGSGKNLGSPVEFKTGAEFAYRFDNAMRLGLSFDHISNAGLTRRNPGTEELLLVFSLPVPW
jgi:lipid A 3-O-deacylase